MLSAKKSNYPPYKYLFLHLLIWLLGGIFMLNIPPPHQLNDFYLEVFFFLACVSTFVEIMRLRLGWLMSIGWASFTGALALDVLDEFLPSSDSLTAHVVLENILQFGLILICVAFLQIIKTNRSLIADLNREIDFRRQLEVRLKKIAHQDALTELYNRRAFFDKYQNLISRFAAPVLIYIDFDNFKQLNDTQGHEKGDEYLVYFARTLTAQLGNEGRAFRFGGDEFVVIYGGDQAEQFIARLRDKLSNINFKTGVDLSYGLINMSKNIPSDQLIKEADELMYRNKQEKKHRQARVKQPRPKPSLTSDINSEPETNGNAPDAQ